MGVIQSRNSLVYTISIRSPFAQDICMVARFYQKNWAICNPIKTKTWHEIIRVKISQRRSFVNVALVPQR